MHHPVFQSWTGSTPGLQVQIQLPSPGAGPGHDSYLPEGVPPATLTDRHKYECTICHKMFVSKTGLRSHEDAHRGVYRYTCEVCGRGFHAHSHLRGHMATHTKVREFSCQYCSKEYAYSGDLSRHVSQCSKRRLEEVTVQGFDLGSGGAS